MIYRIRKSWSDAKSQIGAYTILRNAVLYCKENYNIYNANGQLIYFYPKSLGNTCPYEKTKRTLRKGCRGEDVKWLQWQLTNLGYYCGVAGIDGDFGNGTYKGVETYQIAYGLDVDGIVGPQTIQSLTKNGKPSEESQIDPQQPVNGFKPRLTIPEKRNPYYNSLAAGGYAVGTIKGNPLQSGLDVLSNCFSGDTKIITREGIVQLKDIVDKEVWVLSKDGIYRKAIGRCFGEQELFKIVFNNGDSYKCTANHRWVVRKGNNNDNFELVFKETKDLTKNSYIPYNFIRDEEYDLEGIKHGFIYGDGSYYNNKNQSQANLCGKKREYMKDYFSDALHTCYQSDGTICCYPYPKEYKKIPDLSKPLPYLRGFIKGLIASDGCVDIKGCTRIGTVKEEDAKRISEICSILGYRNTLTFETRDTNYKKNSILYLIRLKKSALPLSLFINPEQIERVSQKKKNTMFTRVKEIVSLGYKEFVYCVQEPETHTMTLETGILTGQCVGYAAARFNEIIGKGKWVYLTYPPNAEDFIDAARAQGLEISQTPSLGSIIVWAKGKTHNSYNGAGHVAVVESIEYDAAGRVKIITTSESGYGCATPFWVSRRSNDGNWGGGAAYRFIGFIKNPSMG